MVKVVVDDYEHTIIEIIHWIPESTFDDVSVSRESIIDAEIDLMKKELKEDYPAFSMVFAYPKRSSMAEPKDETYEEAIHKLEDIDNGVKALKVTLRGVVYY